MPTARELLEQLRAQQAQEQPNEARALLEQLRAEQATTEQADEILLDAFARNVAQPFNKGIVNFLALPTDLVEGGLGLVGIDVELGGDALRDVAARLGFIAPEGQEAEGIVPRTAEIFGGSVVPGGIAMRAGRVALQLPEHARSIVQNIAALAAQSPKANIALDGLTSLTAATGGELVRTHGGSPELVALGELAGGLSPVVFMNGLTARLVRMAPDMIRKTFTPFTSAGAKPRAAARVQGMSGAPETAAANIGGFPEMSPARQSGDPGLLALEARVLSDNPAAARREMLRRSEIRASNLREIELLLQGDPDLARELIRSRVTETIRRADAQARVAAENAAAAITALDPQASPREISVIVRDTIESTEAIYRQQEARLWSQVDRGAPVQTTNAREVMERELKRSTRFRNPEDIPAWLRNALMGRRPPRTVGEIQDIRSRVLQEAREERAKTVPNRNKLRLLAEIQNALLNDADNAGQVALRPAIAFSRALNERFTQGRIGELLGYGRRGEQSVGAEKTLDFVITGRDPGRHLDQLLSTVPSAHQEVRRYIAANYLLQAGTRDGIDVKAAERFIAKMRSAGIFERLPGLEQELRNVTSLQRDANRLGLRARHVQRLIQQSKRARVALYLSEPPGNEMANVLRSRRPELAARALRTKLRGDAHAEQGLKMEFAAELLRQSGTGFDEFGQQIISGARFAKLLNQDYAATARALGFTDQEMARLRLIAERMRLNELVPGPLPGKVIDDTPAFFLDLLARWLGAQHGQQLASGTGSAFVMAQAMSHRARQILGNLTRDKAREMIIAAVDNPQLMRDLLTYPLDTGRRAQRAFARIEAWLGGVAASEDE